jgi:hypothetical protein
MQISALSKAINPMNHGPSAPGIASTHAYLVPEQPKFSTPPNRSSALPHGEFQPDKLGRISFPV